MAQRLDGRLDGEMQREGAAINRGVDAIRQAATAEEHAVEQHLVSVIGGAETVAVVLGLGGVLLGLALAFLIGRGIAAPVVGMTGAMSKLTAGDLTTGIPAQERGDEIGDMAKAVVAFKDNMIKARDAAAREAEQSRRARRGRCGSTRWSASSTRRHPPRSALERAVAAVRAAAQAGRYLPRLDPRRLIPSPGGPGAAFGPCGRRRRLRL